MTSSDRALVLWLRDFMEDQLSGVDFPPTIRRMNASKRMLQRWLDKDRAERDKAGRW